MKVTTIRPAPTSDTLRRERGIVISIELARAPLCQGELDRFAAEVSRALTGAMTCQERSELAAALKKERAKIDSEIAAALNREELI